jgi:hypothetical protein
MAHVPEQKFGAAVNLLTLSSRELMTSDKATKGGSIFGRIKTKLTGGGARNKSTVAIEEDPSAGENLKIMEEYGNVRQQPEQLTGWDFDRAFEFIEKYPDSPQAEKLKNEMYGTTSETLKGLSYPSAVKILQRMPDHPGVDSITRGLGKVEEDYVKELRSDIITFILETIPDHPIKETLTRALASKNLTNAYDFVERNPDHPCAPMVIQAMFDCEANIATLLLHERMDHPQVEAIFKGIYSISEEAVGRLMPDAILFIMDVASDHKYADQMLVRLVEKNYVKAFEYIQTNPDHVLAGRIAELIGERKPELKSLLG